MFSIPGWNRAHYAKMQTPWRSMHIVARSNSNDGCCEAYLWFNISYLHKKNTILNGNNISFNLAYIICKFTMHKSDYLPFKSSKLHSFEVNSKQGCSLQYYRDQIPICLSIRRYHRRENTYISENTTKNIAAVISTF